MNFEDTLKQYFEKLIKTDTAISAVYEEAKISKCASYIISQAKKQAQTHNCAVVSDEIVYKWARDFMLGDIEKDYKPEETVKAEIVHSEEAEKEIKPKKESKKKAEVSKPDFEKDQLMLFDF